ncbi:MAG: hypothetical protein Q9182_003449, partial [Xanthomendoza sp. 2 TL-2023]
MARKPQCQPPLVSVIHHDVGEDRSISIEVFLRSLKRVPSKRFPILRAPKRQQLNPSHELQPNTPTTSSGTPLLIADEIPKVQPPCEQNHDIVISPHVSGDLEHVLQQRWDESYTAECLLPDIHDGRSRGDDSLDLEQTKDSSKGRLPTVIVTYSKRKKKSLHPTVIEERPPKAPGKSPRRRVPVNELVLVDNAETPNIPRISKPDQPNGQRTPARKPLSEIRPNIRPSKGTSIDPTEFKFPPSTPSNAKPVTWRLGSGFKRLPKHPEQQQKPPSPVQNTKARRDLNRLARQIQSTSNASSIPRTQVHAVPTIAPIEDIEDARLPETSPSIVSTNAE